MHDVARIRFTGGERLMPARSGYDCELVFAEAECCARRYGEARLELRSMAMLVRPTEAGRAVCARCHHPIDRIDFSLGQRHLCRRCVRIDSR